MESIHYKFQIQDKVTRTTTDNGSNFVKSFVHYGPKADKLPHIAPDDVNDDVESALDMDEDDDVNTEAVSIQNLFFLNQVACATNYQFI